MLSIPLPLFIPPIVPTTLSFVLSVSIIVIPFIFIVLSVPLILVPPSILLAVTIILTWLCLFDLFPFPLVIAFVFRTEVLRSVLRWLSVVTALLAALTNGGLAMIDARLPDWGLLSRLAPVLRIPWWVVVRVRLRIVLLGVLWKGFLRARGLCVDWGFWLLVVRAGIDCPLVELLLRVWHKTVDYLSCCPSADCPERLAF